jgi:hypothetical protein
MPIRRKGTTAASRLQREGSHAAATTSFSGYFGFSI